MSVDLFELLRASKGIITKTSYDCGDSITTLYDTKGRCVAERIITDNGDILFSEV